MDRQGPEIKAQPKESNQVKGSPLSPEDPWISAVASLGKPLKTKEEGTPSAKALI